MPESTVTGRRGCSGDDWMVGGIAVMKMFFHGNTVLYVKGQSGRVAALVELKGAEVVLALLILRFVWHFLPGGRAMVSAEGSVEDLNL